MACIRNEKLGSRDPPIITSAREPVLADSSTSARVQLCERSNSLRVSLEGLDELVALEEANQVVRSTCLVQSR